MKRPARRISTGWPCAGPLGFPRYLAPMTAPHAVIGRFAPSPTGAMHMGNARTALLAWLHSRVANGRHLLRFEDLDVGRVRDWAYDVTRRDLEWLGLDWDEESLQSSHIGRYEVAAALLDTYGCTCTRKEIQQAIVDSAGAPHGEEPVYPGTCRSGPLSADRAPARRWRVPDWTVCVPDMLSGAVHCQNLGTQVGDFVLQRGDGVYAYHLAVVVDDAASGVTDIVRGEDLLPATPRQVALQRALGLPTPHYFHVPLMTGFRGQRLAKRAGAPPLMALREGGEQPGRVLAALAASLGWPVPDEVSADELVPLWRNFISGAQT